jgi:hypothetical protein
MLHIVKPRVQHMFTAFLTTFNFLLGLSKQKNLETRSKNNNMSQNWDIVKFVKRIYQSHGSLKKYTIGNLAY